MSFINNRGSISLTGLLLLSSLSLLFLFYLVKKKKDHYYLHKNLSQILCVKEANGELKRLVSRVDLTDQLISASRALELIPQFSIGARSTRKGLESLQNYFLFSFLKKKASFLFNECSSYQHLLKVPYQYTRVMFRRDPTERTTIIKRKQWKKTVKIGNQKSFIFYKLDGGLKMNMKKKKGSL